jgi:GNAT superfamily N-acetyltransferase
MSSIPRQSTITPGARVVNSEEDIISGDIIDVDFPHVRPFFDSMTGRKEDVITKKGSDKPAYSDGFPCALIGRLAVDKEYKGHNIGTSIVYWAVGIVADQVSKYIGVTYITVDLKAESRNFYIKLGFIDMYEMQRQLRNSSHSRTRSIASEMLQTPISPSSLMRLKWASLVIKIAPVCRQVAA